MSQIVTTKLGRFRIVSDGDAKKWLWECPDCEMWGGLSREQWSGTTSVYCTNPVREHYGMNPRTDMRPCGYHQTHDFARELVAVIQTRALFGEPKFDAEEAIRRAAQETK